MKTTWIFFSLLLFALPAQATTYYVAKTGSGTACTLAAPCLTIAAGLAKLSPGAGDTLLIRAGTYVEAIIPTAIPSGGGSWATATKVLAETGNTVIIQPTTGWISDPTVAVGVAYSQSYIIFGGEDNSAYDMIVDATDVGGMGVRIYDGGSAHHIKIQNAEIRNSVAASSCTGDAPGNHDDWWYHNKVHDCGRQSTEGNPGGHGIYLAASSSGIVEYNEIYNVGCSPLVETAPTCLTGFGIHQYVSSGSGNNNKIRYNKIYDSLAGILAGGGTGNQVYGNLIYNVGAAGSDNPYGIEIGYGSDSGTRVMNNTVYNAAYCMHLRNSSAGGYVQNNLCLAGAATVSNIIVDDGSGNTKDHNVFSADATLVTNTATNDFHIRNTDAAALIDKGVDLSAYFTLDRDSVALPQSSAFDIGAYEFVGSVPGPVPSAVARRRSF